MIPPIKSQLKHLNCVSIENYHVNLCRANTMWHNNIHLN
jgi:hypothetical protein